MPTFLTIPVGDWLQAGANVVTVVLTIVGTLSIERWRLGRPQREARNRIGAALKDMVAAAKIVAHAIPDDSTVWQNYVTSVEAQNALVNAIRRYRFVREVTQITDAKLWEALKFADTVIDNQMPLLETELRSITEHGENEKVYRINRQKVSAAAMGITIVTTEACHLTGAD